MSLVLKRPLVFFDLETTGTSITRDRIVEISIVKVFPGEGHVEEYCRRINPGMPIPAEATAVHHITDSDVADAPRFETIAAEVARLFENSDIAGFNSNKFDLPLLYGEMARAGVPFDVKDAGLIDVQTIFHKKEPRNLVAAYRFYCNKDLTEAHSALADTRATVEVFKAQLNRYDDLPSTIEGLSEYTNYGNYADFSGRFVYNDKKEVVINFGKYKGKLLSSVLKTDPSYYSWMLESDFPVDTRQVLMREKQKLDLKK